MLIVHFNLQKLINKIEKINSIFLVCRYPNFLFFYIRNIADIFGSVFSFKFRYENFQSFYILSGIIKFYKENHILNYKNFFYKSESWKKKFKIYFIREKKRKNENKIKKYLKKKIYYVRIKFEKESVANFHFLYFFRKFASCSSKLANICSNQNYRLKIVLFYNFFAAEYCYLSSDGEFFLSKKTETFLVKKNFFYEYCHENPNLISKKNKNFGISIPNFHDKFSFTFIRLNKFEKTLWKSFNQISKLIADYTPIKKKILKFSKNLFHLFHGIKNLIFFNIYKIFFFSFKTNRNKKKQSLF